MSKHTTGPLTVTREKKWPFSIITRDASGDVLLTEHAMAYSTKMETIDDFNSALGFKPEERADVIAANERQWADAVLRAAAPELLAALLMVLDDHDALDGRPRTYDQVRAAIAKATGE